MARRRRQAQNQGAHLGRLGRADEATALAAARPRPVDQLPGPAAHRLRSNDEISVPRTHRIPGPFRFRSVLAVYRPLAQGAAPRGDAGLPPELRRHLAPQRRRGRPAADDPERGVGAAPDGRGGGARAARGGEDEGGGPVAGDVPALQGLPPRARHAVLAARPPQGASRGAGGAGRGERSGGGAVSRLKVITIVSDTFRPDHLGANQRAGATWTPAAPAVTPRVAIPRGRRPAPATPARYLREPTPNIQVVQLVPVRVPPHAWSVATLSR